MDDTTVDYKKTMAWIENNPHATLIDPLGLLYPQQVLQNGNVIVKWLFDYHAFNAEGECNMRVAVGYPRKDRAPLADDECSTTLAYTTLIKYAGLEKEFEQAWVNYTNQSAIKEQIVNFRNLCIESWTDDAEQGLINPTQWRELLGYDMPESVWEKGRMAVKSTVEQLYAENN